MDLLICDEAAIKIAEMVKDVLLGLGGVLVIIAFIYFVMRD